MSCKYLLATFLVLQSPLPADERTHLSGAGIDPEVDARSFTSTQKWAPKYLERTKQEPQFLPANWKERFSVPTPPANSSVRTHKELAYLRTLIPERIAKLPEIDAEQDADNFKFGQHSLHALTSSPEFAATGKLLTAAYRELAIVTFTFKKQHNRIRPSILSPGLRPVIEIPQHPAYPSGHAVGGFTLAYLLQELDPGHVELYRRSAQRIAHNREIAGVHYPSDTAAGQSLARQLTDVLLANPEFLALLDAARKEW